MDIYETKWFARFARRQRISSRALKHAIDRLEQGLVDVDLGGGLIKQRVARPGQGRSGGHRLLIAYRENDRAVFLYGFAKNERDNITEDELLTLRELGTAWLNAPDHRICAAFANATLLKVDDED